MNNKWPQLDMETLMMEIQKIQPHITPEQLKQFFIIKHCVIDNPYIPHMPTDKQLRFLKLLDEEDSDIFSYEREYEGKKLLVVCSFAKEKVRYTLPDDYKDAEILIGN